MTENKPDHEKKDRFWQYVALSFLGLFAMNNTILIVNGVTIILLAVFHHLYWSDVNNILRNMSLSD